MDWWEIGKFVLTAIVTSITTSTAIIKVIERMIEHRVLILKGELSSQSKTDFQTFELKIEKKIADQKIEISKDVLDLRDRFDKSRDQNEIQFNGLNNKFDFFAKSHQEEISRNTYDIGILKQAQMDRDKWHDEFREEIRNGFKEIKDELRAGRK